MKKYYIWTLGCQMNKSDSERISSVMTENGFIECDKTDSADVIIVVACSIRQSAIDRIYGRSKNWQSRRRKSNLVCILTGCVLDSDREKMRKKFDFIIPIDEIGRLPYFLLSSNRKAIKDYFCVLPSYSSSAQAYVPIMTGCNNFCSYCVVPYLRGRERSRSVKNIIAECQELIAAGYKEITLLGQNVNSYKSGGYDFPKLLRKIDSLPGDYWIRFISSHPKDFSNKLIEVMAKGRHITPYLHLPIQSGDNQVLRAMNRRYQVKDYKKIINKAKKNIPNLMLSTDFIVGFPGETKKMFSGSAKLMREIGFDMAYIAQYSARPQTAASRLSDDVTKAEKKRREEFLTKILKKTAAKNNKKLIGKRQRVLVESCKRGKCVGKNSSFRSVSFLGDNSLVGNFVEVEVVSADAWGLQGKVYRPKLVVVLGPTACGKTKLAAKLAGKYNGEIISADSRQVYRGMDIGTGKDLADYSFRGKPVKYHLIDVVGPKSDFNVHLYQKLAYKAIDQVAFDGHLPFLVGGSGLYLDSVIYGYKFFGQFDKKVRAKLEKLSLKELLAELKKKDPQLYETIDQKNRRRVQRSLEKIYQGAEPARKEFERPLYDILILGIKFPLQKIYQKIDSRLEKRVKEGMIKEVKQLRKEGVSWKKLDDFGLEYRWVSRYLRGQLQFDEMIEKLKKEIHRFAKRQITWFKRNEDIKWIDNYKEAEQYLKEFMKD